MTGVQHSDKSVFRAIRRLGIICGCLVFAACAGPSILPESEPLPPSYAEAPATSGPLAELADNVRARHGPDQSGFRLLDASHEALSWRLALIDSAVSSLDILTYLWYEDTSGELIFERAILAAQRGVRVRLVVDDLLTIGQDQILANIQAQPNVEIRIFNPWRNRSLGSRAGAMIAEMERLNTRMHDKLIIADGHAAIMGGRNLGDHYFGLNRNYNFHDLDVLSIGAIANEANEMFDHFWNSEWLVSAERLSVAPAPEIVDRNWAALQERIRTAPELESFATEPKDWSAEFETLEDELQPGTGYVVYDEMTETGVDQSMIGTMFGLFEQAEDELFITNAYIIPGKYGIEMLRRLDARGVDIRILTNSLASHDVPAVNSHYEPWRRRLLRSGVELYEFRADPAIKPMIDAPAVVSKFSGLHTKAAVIDRRTVFIGSMNLDPRSASINTEMGAVIDSPGLAREVRRVMLRDMSGENAWRITMDDKERLAWTNSDETVRSQPSRGILQDVMNLVLKIAPKDQF